MGNEHSCSGVRSRLPDVVKDLELADSFEAERSWTSSIEYQVLAFRCISYLSADVRVSDIALNSKTLDGSGSYESSNEF